MTDEQIRSMLNHAINAWKEPKDVKQALKEEVKKLFIAKNKLGLIEYEKSRYDSLNRETERKQKEMVEASITSIDTIQVSGELSDDDKS